MLTYIKNRLRSWLIDEQYIRRLIAEELAKSRQNTNSDLLAVINRANISS